MPDIFAEKLGNINYYETEQWPIGVIAERLRKI